MSGDSIATCQTWQKAGETGCGSTVDRRGQAPASLPPALSYVTGGGTGDRTSFLVGRVPPTATAVRLTFAEANGIKPPADPRRQGGVALGLLGRRGGVRVRGWPAAARRAMWAR